MEEGKRKTLAFRFVKRFCIVLSFLHTGCSQQENQQVSHLPATVTYTEHIAPLLQKSCISCHRNGGSAPFALDNYQETAKRAGLIAFATRTGYMPPWKPDVKYTSFIGERWLTEDEIALFQKWKDTGTQYGTGSFHAAPKEQPSIADVRALQIEPDSIFTVKNDGNEYYVSYLFRNISDTAIYSNCIQFQPANYPVTHHAAMLVDTAGQFHSYKVSGNILNVEKNEFHLLPAESDIQASSLHALFGLYIPGVEKAELNKGAYYRIPPHADVIVQVHYVNHFGGEQAASFNLIFHPVQPEGNPIKTMLVNDEMLVNGPFVIKANTQANFYLEGDVLQQSVRVHRLYPHMHFRGAHFLAYALNMSGDTIPLIRIKNWDFRWQGTYVFKNPPVLPAGSKIRVEGAFDNTNNNPFNPSIPAVDVRYGMRSEDEMLELWVEYTEEATP